MVVKLVSVRIILKRGVIKERYLIPYNSPFNCVPYMDDLNRRHLSNENTVLLRSMLRIDDIEETTFRKSKGTRKQVASIHNTDARYRI